MLKKLTFLLFIGTIVNNYFAQAQSLPLPAHTVIVIYENHAYEEIVGSSNAPYINSLIADTDAALFTKSYAITSGSQPNYLDLYSGDDQGLFGDNITTTQLTTCNIGSSLMVKGLSFRGYSEDLPSIGYLGSFYGAYARKHNPWSNWQGTSTNQIPDSTNAPFSMFPSDFDSLPIVSFVVPNENDNMHDGTVTDGDTWLENNMKSYVTWAKSHNSLMIFTFDEDDGNYSEHITTLFIGQMVKGGSYSNTINHYTVCRTIEDIYGLADCANSSSYKPITNCWRSKSSGVGQLSVNNNPLTIFPNPAQDELTLTYNSSMETTIDIFDVMGRKVMQQNISPNSGSETIDISSLPKGLYLIKVNSVNGMATGNFIKEF